MPAAGRVDSFLHRHATWFTPGLLALFALAMVLVLALDREPAAAGSAAVVLPHRAAAAPRLGTPVPPADVVGAAPIPTLLSAAGPAADGRVQVCSVGWTSADAAGRPDLGAVAAAPSVERARREVLRTLSTSGDAFTRAAAAQMQAVPGAGRALAEAAASARDPRVYAMAYRACRGRDRDDAACRAVDTAQWSRLDDGNGLPWLYALDDAARRGDAAGRDDALFRIASARRLDERAYAVPAAIADVAGRDDASLLAAWTLATDYLAASSIAAAAPYGALVAACAAPADSNRAQLCAGSAELLTERSDAVDAWLAGAAVARAAGREVVQADEVARRAAAARAEISAESYDCTRMRRDLARWQEGAAAGEMALLRRRP